MDTCAAAEVCKKVARTKFSLNARAVLQAIDKLQTQYTFDGLFYDAALESNPDLLDSIPVDRVVGNTSQTLRQCKDPKVFFSTLDQHAIHHPEVSFEPDCNSTDSWLIKHATGTGGVGVRVYVRGKLGKVSLEKNTYFQKKIEGVNFSLTFFANARQIKSLGFNTLWSEALGENVPYAYAGAINWVDLTEQQQDTTIYYATTLTREFKLVGLNSIDCILSEDRIYVLEINPRIPATYELYETRYGDLIKEHISVCATNKLVYTVAESLLRAHAIIYAHESIQVPKDFMWPLWTADRPHPEEAINKHEPVCSIFSGGKNVAQVREMIHTRKKTIPNKLILTDKNNKKG